MRDIEAAVAGEGTTLSCSNCGRTFSSSRPVKGKPFCGLSCRFDSFSPEAKAVRESNRPLLMVHESSVDCAICGKTLSVVGSHMMTHGIYTRGLGHLERNLLFGLKQGDRTVPETRRDTMRAHSLVNPALRANHGRRGPVDWEKVGQLRSSVPICDSLREKCIENAHAAHERACVTVPCEMCSTPFVKTQSDQNTKCKQCRGKRYRTIPKVFDNSRAGVVAQIMTLKQSMSRREIAEKLGISKRMVKRLLKEGRAVENGDA